jgi:hypothetical protein
MRSDARPDFTGQVYLTEKITHFFFAVWKTVSMRKDLGGDFEACNTFDSVCPSQLCFGGAIRSDEYVSRCGVSLQNSRSGFRSKLAPSD